MTTLSPASALETATEALRKLISGDPVFAKVFAEGIALHHSKRHQVFHFKDRSLVYPLFACVDDMELNQPVLISVWVQEGFITDCAPEKVSIGLFRRYMQGNPNDYVKLNGTGMGSIPLGVQEIPETRSRDGQGFLIAFKQEEFIKHSVNCRLNSW